MAGVITLYKMTNREGQKHFISCCNRDCTSITTVAGELTFYANIHAATDHYFYNHFRKPARQLGLSLTNGASENPAARRHALDYPVDSVDEAAGHNADTFGVFVSAFGVVMLCLRVTNPSQAQCKQLKCAMAYQVTHHVIWDSAIARYVDLHMHPQLPVIDLAGQLQLSLNDSEVEEPLQQRRRLRSLSQLPEVECGEDGHGATTLFAPFSEAAMDHVIGQVRATGKLVEPSFFSSMASFPGDSVIGLRTSIPLFESPLAALVQLKFQILAAHATGHVHDPVQWNTCSPGLDPYNLEGMVLMEVTFKKQLWQKMHALPILGKSRACPIFHYKLLVPLPMKHPGYSWKVYRTTMAHSLLGESCLKVHFIYQINISKHGYL